MNNAKSGLETERKFLIKLPDDLTDIQSGEMNIIQIYLKRNDPDIQRRIRKITRGGGTEYVYTEKKKISDITREENEFSISSAEYETYYHERDTSLTPVEKTRHFIDYKNQHFELDEYPFSDKLATIELELEDESQQIELPPFIDVIKEVTGDPRYFNAALSAANSFPKE